MFKSKFLSPFQQFVKLESFSGILLLISTLVALLWANSSLSDSYFNLWQLELGISFMDWSLTKPLILWINDGLMGVFFFVIGLEIKREIMIGELNSIKKASLPLFAAVGGILIPLLVYKLLNTNPETSDGWGIPMATDIAFTLAVLKALGKRVPLSLKIFLTAFAIVDDLGAVLVIAIFYSGSIKWMLILIALAIVTSLLFSSKYGFYKAWFTFLCGTVVWYLFLKAGIHPTIAGVLMAFAIPIRQNMNVKEFIPELKALSDKILNSPGLDKPILSAERLTLVGDMENLTEKVHSPLQSLEHELHYWVAYAIMPIFALSNAGVNFVSAEVIDWSLVINIALALVIGKGIGISLLSWIGIKLKLAELPAGTEFKQIIGVAVLAALGFTMSIFITNLAFADKVVYLDSAKIGVIFGSVIAAISGYTILLFSSKKSITS